jgi:hypothetical protein
MDLAKCFGVFVWWSHVVFDVFLHPLSDSFVYHFSLYEH